MNVMTQTITFFKNDLQSNTIKVSGFKHLTVVIINAIVTQPNIQFIIKNVPNIQDTRILIQILHTLGATVIYKNNILRVETTNMNCAIIPEELSKQIHGAIYLIPVLLGRFGEIKIGQCGGCAIGESSIIGSRPIAHMIQVLEKFGATFSVKNGLIYGKCERYNATALDIMSYSTSNRNINGPYVSGATKTALLAALCVHKGKTIIKNIYPKPDAVELIKFISLLPYKVYFDKNNVIIERCQKIIPITKVEFEITADVSEVITWITVSHYHKVPLYISGVNQTCINALLPEFLALMRMGLNHYYDSKQNILHIVPNNQYILPIDIEIRSTEIYSDHQPFFCLLLTKALGTSSITDNVWQNRFQYINEMSKVGFYFTRQSNTVKIFPGHLSVLPCIKYILNAHDLRSAAVLIIMALNQPNVSITGVEHIERGYENFFKKLSLIGGLYEVN